MVVVVGGGAVLVGVMENGVSSPPASDRGENIGSPPPPLIPTTPGLRRRLTRRIAYTPAKYKVK